MSSAGFRPLVLGTMVTIYGLLVACSSSDGDGGGADTDADTDGDTDSDSDTDTDADTDTDNDTDIDGDTDTDTDSDIDSDSDSDVDTGTDYPDQDSDGWVEGIDCDDENPDANQDQTEIPDNKVDDDCDGLTDEEPTDTDPQVPDWLIHISDDKLWHIPIETGIANDICDLVPEKGVTLPTFQSVTFTREDRLIVSSGGDRSLWEIFLPSCEIVKIGDITPYQSFPGICPDAENGLYGITPISDELYALDPDTAMGTLVGSLGIDFGNTGGTWVEEEQNVYSITDQGAVDALYVVDKDTGTASLIASLTANFGSVGMEYHPHNSQIYACTNPEAEGYSSAPLFHIALDGTATLIAETGLPDNCDNLGAPWGEPELPPVD